MSSLPGQNPVQHRFIEPKNLYALIVSIFGICVFLLSNDYAIFELTLSEWVQFYALVGSVLLLNHFTFQLPPDGNMQSMDSAVFLACLFVYGLGFTLNILIVGSFIFALYHRALIKTWWKHVVNFAIYAIMITGSSYIFSMSGGSPGVLDIDLLYAYLGTLVFYFVVNVLLVGVYYYLSIKNSFFMVIKDMSKQTLTAYFSTLLLSIILTILMSYYNTFGLFVFLCVTTMLSHAFKQFFNMYNEIAEKAIKDQRTGLFNHGYFEERLEREVALAKRENSPLSLVLLDIDNFKKYNEVHGHLKGDKLLEFFGQTMKKECAFGQMIVARYGGEEFSIMMTDRNETEAYHFVNNLRKKVNDTYYEGVEVLPYGCLSFSAGIASFNKDTFDKSQLVHKAYQALFVAKNQGKNCVHLYQDEAVVHKAFEIEQDMKEIELQLRIFLTKDIYTFQHSKRVYQYAVDMAGALPLTDHEKKTLMLGALFHDIGKVEVPREILTKKGKLTDDEWQTIKNHVLWGKEIVSTIPKFRDLVPLVELHHEKYDGTGYPHRLKGEDIPKLARILTVIDSFDAMTTERPYQRTKTLPEAVEELRRCAGKQFDPYYVDAFIDLIGRKDVHYVLAGPVH